jgi:hypothetical protein
MRRQAIWSLVLVVLSVAVCAATVVEPATLRELTRDAALIVRGQVTDVRATAARAGGIESIATVAVARTIKGAAGPFVSVRVPGGLIGRHRQVVIGAPTLRTEQVAVFFLVRDVDNVWRPVGLSAGVVPLRREITTGRLVVRPVVAPGRTAGVGPINRGDVRRRALTIDEFEALVALVQADQTPIFEWRPRP